MVNENKESNSYRQFCQSIELKYKLKDANQCFEFIDNLLKRNSKNNTVGMERLKRLLLSGEFLKRAQQIAILC